MDMGMIILSACQSQGEDKDQIVKKSSELAIKFLKDKENVNFLVDDYEFTSAIGGGSIFINGHDKNKPSEELTVTVSYTKEGSYEVGGVAHDRYLNDDSME